MATKEPLNSKKYIDGIYIPAGLLVFGTFIVKREWVPYAVVLALALGALKFIRTRTSTVYTPLPLAGELCAYLPWHTLFCRT